MSSFLLLALLLGLSAASINFTTVFEWNTFDFVWPSEDFGKEALRKGDYVPTKIFPEDHVVYGERVFISIFNSSKHPTPATLTWLRSTSNSRSPKLNPYPSWRMHEKGNCMTIQEIKGMVVDARGHLWAVDNGNEICPAKLWIFDLTENDSLSLVHQFTNDTVAHTFRDRDLNSLVLDKRPNDTLAYIPDYVSGNLIVFSLNENASWAVQIKDISNVSCIALSPKLIYLGFSINTALYSVPLSELRTKGQKAPLAPTLVGNKKAGSFKMLMDNKGKLYFDLKNLSYIGIWDTTAPFKEEELYKENQEMAVLPSEPTASSYAIQREQLDEEMYDDVAPPVTTTSVQIELGSASNVYEEVYPLPPGSELYLCLH
ncbi:Hypothetical predicted protein [Cloeon dipterum]|uniref:Bee-milk protein n=1 Tax=Cloeon dipterum TaxID=197152 RepID=A0A8S1D638_9INSE|nr:Hypothetical predicted protein [Cloeon dipterum]